MSVTRLFVSISQCHLVTGTYSGEKQDHEIVTFVAVRGRATVYALDLDFDFTMEWLDGSYDSSGNWLEGYYDTSIEFDQPGAITVAHADRIEKAVAQRVWKLFEPDPEAVPPYDVDEDYLEERFTWTSTSEDDFSKLVKFKYDAIDYDDGVYVLNRPIWLEDLLENRIKEIAPWQATLEDDRLGPLGAIEFSIDPKGLDTYLHVRLYVPDSGDEGPEMTIDLSLRDAEKLLTELHGKVAEALAYWEYLIEQETEASLESTESAESQGSDADKPADPDQGGES